MLAGQAQLKVDFVAPPLMHGQSSFSRLTVYGFQRTPSERKETGTFLVLQGDWHPGQQVSFTVNVPSLAADPQQGFWVVFCIGDSGGSCIPSPNLLSGFQIFDSAPTSDQPLGMGADVSSSPSPTEKQEPTPPQITKAAEAPVNPKAQVDMSAEHPRPLAGEDRIIGLWNNDNPRVHGRLLEIKRNPKAPGFVAIEASDESTTSYKGEVIYEFAFNVAQRKFIGRHLWGGGKETKRSWGRTGALTIELNGPDSLKVYFLDSKYTGGWTYSRVTEH
jgi:hypothetical protein